jgi:hypothetical protein
MIFKKQLIIFLGLLSGFQCLVNKPANASEPLPSNLVRYQRFITTTPRLDFCDSRLNDSLSSFAFGAGSRTGDGGIYRALFDGEAAEALLFARGGSGNGCTYFRTSRGIIHKISLGYDVRTRPWTWSINYNGSPGRLRSSTNVDVMNSSFFDSNGVQHSFVIFWEELGINLGSGAPAPMFTPILSAMRQQLPRGMSMRLPISIPMIDFEGKEMAPLYANLEPYRNGMFRVSINSMPDCISRACQLGYIATYHPNATEQQLSDSHISYRNSGQRIKLGNGVEGVYAQVYSDGASSGNYGLVIWKQNNQWYVVSLGNDRHLNIGVARSMVGQQQPVQSLR